MPPLEHAFLIPARTVRAPYGSSVYSSYYPQYQNLWIEPIDKKKNNLCLWVLWTLLSAFEMLVEKRLKRFPVSLVIFKCFP